jgi:glutamate racemase
VNASRKRSIGVLGTSRTIDDPYIKELAGQSGPDCRLTGIAAPDLVSFVEQGGDSAGIEEQRRQVEPYVAEFRKAGADAVVLGCTHFVFLRDAFEAASQTGEPGESIRIFDSVEGVVGRAESLLEENGLCAELLPVSREVLSDGGRPNLLVLTGDGPPEERWRQRAEAAGLLLRRRGEFE